MWKINNIHYSEEEINQFSRAAEENNEHPDSTEVVCRYRGPQLQVGENLNYLF